MKRAFCNLIVAGQLTSNTVVKPLRTNTKYVGLIIISILAFSFLTSMHVISGAGLDNSNQTSNLSSNAKSPPLGMAEHSLSSTELLELKNLIGVYQDGKNYNQIVDGHGTGLIPPTEEEWSEIARNTNMVHALTASHDLPSSIDLSATPWFPPIGDQAQQGSCAAWAVGYYTKTFQEAKDHFWNLSGATWNETQPAVEYQDKIISPAFIYNLLNGGADEGLWFETPIQLICSVGAASWQEMPYTDKNCTAWPSESAWTEAASYRGASSGYKFINVDSTEGLTNLKQLLISGNLAITAVDAYKFKNFTDNDVLVADKYVDIELNHAATIVGYDDNITYLENGQLTQGAFKIANSWGIEQLHANMISWENVLDGCYWISYETMKQQVSWCIYYEDRINYQPTLLATFRIDHPLRSEASITIGLGTPTAPLATKVFSEYKTYSASSIGYVFGGSHPFCPNNIVLDITEFTTYLSLYNQPFFLKVHDSGTPATGNVTYFSIKDSSCVGTPVETKQNENVNVNVNYTSALPSLIVSPTSGPPSNTVKLTVIGFNLDSSVDLSYLNPVTSTWTPIINNLTVTSSPNFTYAFTVPDLMLVNPAGDNLPLFDEIVFNAQDSAYAYSCNATAPYIQWRRGLNQIGNAFATGLYGNNTDLTSSLLVQVGQSLLIAGQWFSPGNATLLWDNTTSLGVAVIDAAGRFNTTVIVPTTEAGLHSITIKDSDVDFCINLSRLPEISRYYGNFWHTSDFNINVLAELDGTEIYYTINNGVICNVSANGQPRITTESRNNTIEYWATWNIYGTGNMELSHARLTEIKLDKTPPTGSVTTSTTRTNITLVTLTLSATDDISGVAAMRFSNDNISWSGWEPYATSKTWNLQNEDGQKTVIVQYIDNAGLISAYSYMILLETQVQPTATPSSTATPLQTPSLSTTGSPTATPLPGPAVTPEIPELTFQITLILLILSTLSLTILYKRKSK